MLQFGEMCRGKGGFMTVERVGPLNDVALFAVAFLTHNGTKLDI